MFSQVPVCPYGGGHAWQRRVCMAWGAATAVDGMHPTGMQSCLDVVLFPDYRKQVLSTIVKRQRHSPYIILPTAKV